MSSAKIRCTYKYIQEVFLTKHKSAEKRTRQELKRFERNRAVKASVKTGIKSVREAVAAKNNKEATESALNRVIPSIAKAAAKGAIHKNNAARRISRLTRLVHAAKA
jgi:small subunit ribosomal protein S20